MNRTKKISLSGLIIALYVVIMYFTAGVAFYQHQIRFATALYALAFIHPFLIIPLSIANALSNVLLGGLGLVDIVGGFMVGLLTTSTVVLIKILGMDEYYTFLPVFLIPALLVPIWLGPILGLPYSLLVVSLLIGQFVPAILGVYLIKWIKDH